MSLFRLREGNRKPNRPRKPVWFLENNPVKRWATEVATWFNALSRYLWMNPSDRGFPPHAYAPTHAHSHTPTGARRSPSTRASVYAERNRSDLLCRVTGVFTICSRPTRASCWPFTRHGSAGDKPLRHLRLGVANWIALEPINWFVDLWRTVTSRKVYMY